MILKYYVVIDTNVLVSSLLSKHSNSATVELIERLILGEIIPIYSIEIMNEYREVLSRKKFKFDLALIDFLLTSIERCGVLVSPKSTGVILPDISDLPFYEVVMEKRADDAYLVTGNLKHFPNEKYIVTPREMIDILNSKNN